MSLLFDNNAFIAFCNLANKTFFVLIKIISKTNFDKPLCKFQTNIFVIYSFILVQQYVFLLVVTISLIRINKYISFLYFSPGVIVSFCCDNHEDQNGTCVGKKIYYVLLDLILSYSKMIRVIYQLK